jgi:hypothetical protein
LNQSNSKEYAISVYQGANVNPLKKIAQQSDNFVRSRPVSQLSQQKKKDSQEERKATPVMNETKAPQM